MNENILILLALSAVYLLLLVKVATTSPGQRATEQRMMWLLVGIYALILIRFVSMVLEALRP